MKQSFADYFLAGGYFRGFIETANFAKIRCRKNFMPLVLVDIFTVSNATLFGEQKRQ